MQIASPHPVPVVPPRHVPVIPPQPAGWRGNPFSRPRASGAELLFIFVPAGVQIQKKNRLPPVLSVLPPYLAFLNTVSGAVMTTRVLSATDPVRNALPPTTECSPITVSPPRMDAPE